MYNCHFLIAKKGVRNQGEDPTPTFFLGRVGTRGRRRCEFEFEFRRPRSVFLLGASVTRSRAAAGKREGGTQKQPSQAQPGPARPSPAKPGPAQLSADQLSPAQPNQPAAAHDDQKHP